MESSSSSMSSDSDEERNLKNLLDAFGSMFSLREIASAYCQSGGKSDLAGEILFDLHKTTSTSSIEEGKSSESSESSNGIISSNSYHANGNSKAPKPKKVSASLGTVSCVIGKDYIRSTTLANGSHVTTKPLKVESKEFHAMEQTWEDEINADCANNVGVNKDMEDFLFKILGKGFQMDRTVIRDVLGHCGYDMQKSMDRLLDLSVSSMPKSNHNHRQPPKKLSDTCPIPESSSRQNKFPYVNHSGSNGNVSYTNGSENSRQQRNELEKEVLASLFTAPDIFEKSPRRTRPIMAVKRSNVVRVVVDEPLTDSTSEQTSDGTQQNCENDVYEDDGYQDLRRAVKEYRGTKNEYYKAAVDAFAEGDRARYENLFEKGVFFHQKACEADEESAKKLFETRNVDGQEVFTLDLHGDGVKEAMRLVKCYLSSLSGIPSIKYLKIIMESEEGDITKGARKRRIMKLLEKESVTWIEEGTAGTILISLENINHKRLSFATKSTI